MGTCVGGLELLVVVGFYGFLKNVRNSIKGENIMSKELKFQAFDATVGLGQMINVTELIYRDVNGDLDTVIDYTKDDKEPVIIRVTSHTHIPQ